MRDFVRPFSSALRMISSPPSKEPKHCHCGEVVRKCIIRFIFIRGIIYAASQELKRRQKEKGDDSAGSVPAIEGRPILCTPLYDAPRKKLY